MFPGANLTWIFRALSSALKAITGMTASLRPIPALNLLVTGVEPAAEFLDDLRM